MRNCKTIFQLLIAAIVLPASAARAQTCLGLPSFATGSVHLNLAGEHSPDALGYAAGIGAGKPDDLFANLGGGQVRFRDPTAYSTMGFLEFGYQVSFFTAQVCPIAGGFYAMGPDDELAGIKSIGRGAAGGLALGVRIPLPSLSVIPNAAVRYEFVSQKVEEQDVGSLTTNYTSGVVDVGLSFVFFDRISIQPLAHFYFASENNEATFGVFASFSFPWRADRY